MGDQAGRGGDHVVGALRSESGATIGPGGDPHGRAVAARRYAAAVPDGGCGDATGAPEGVDHDVDPRRTLRLHGEVLPAAAPTALPPGRARRYDPIG